MPEVSRSTAGGAGIFIHEIKRGLAVKRARMQFLRDYRIGEYCKELFKELRVLCEQAAEGQLKNQH